MKKYCWTEGKKLIKGLLDNTSTFYTCCWFLAVRLRITIWLSTPLYSLYVLFSQYKSCENTLENCFYLWILSNSRAQYAWFMKRHSGMFSWDLYMYWENKTFKLKMSIMLRLRKVKMSTSCGGNLEIWIKRKRNLGSFLKKSNRIFEPLREECDFRNMGWVTIVYVIERKW